MQAQQQPTIQVLAATPNTSAVLNWQPYLDPAKDLVLHPLGSDGDSFFIVSYVAEGEHKFTVLFHLMIIAKSALPPLAQLAISVLDEKTNKYYSKEMNSPWLDGIAVASDPAVLDIAISGGHLTGTIEQLNTIFQMADGPHNSPLKFNFVMKPRGPALPNLLTGAIPFSGGVDYEYALPNMETSGELTIRGQTYHVAGRSWLDREWGRFGPAKWTWMNVQLGDEQAGNLVSISLWNQQNNDTAPPSHVGLATILNPDGGLVLTTVDIKELQHWTSPQTKRTYATKWRITFPDGSGPAGKADLTVALLTDDQEIESSIGANRIEGKAKVTGSYDGKPTAGITTVEQYDLFPLFRT
jgi:hypothetical protein